MRGIITFWLGFCSVHLLATSDRTADSSTPHWNGKNAPFELAPNTVDVFPDPWKKIPT